jgi:hypothetical protein
MCSKKEKKMDPKKERYRRIRGWILKFLAEEHPASIEASTIHHLLDDLRYTISREECDSHISYLCEKIFARKEVRGLVGKEIVMVTITPGGLDLLDGFTEDVGVEIPRG